MGRTITHWFHFLKSYGKEGSLLCAGYDRRSDGIKLAVDTSGRFAIPSYEV